MYWISGSVDMRLTSPRSLLPEDHAAFQHVMKEQGWTFTRNDRDPMSEDYSLRHRDGPDHASSRWYADSARWEAQRYLPSRLLQMYEELGLVSSGQALPLCDYCPSNASCWLGMEDRKATLGTNTEWSHVSLPWIGERYSERRIAFVGINPYEAGGLQFFPDLIRENVIPSLGRGNTHLTFNAYAGTTLWHRIGAITAHLLSAWQDDLDFSRISPAEAYSYLAFTNHIKCSPLSLNDRSRPSTDMWQHCGETILKKELDILRPCIVVVLGRSENMYYMDHSVLDKPVSWAYESKYVRYGIDTLNGRRVVLLNVPHPAMGIGKSMNVINEVDTVAYQFKDEIINVRS